MARLDRDIRFEALLGWLLFYNFKQKFTPHLKNAFTAHFLSPGKKAGLTCPTFCTASFFGQSGLTRRPFPRQVFPAGSTRNRRKHGFFITELLLLQHDFPAGVFFQKSFYNYTFFPSFPAQKRKGKLDLPIFFCTESFQADGLDPAAVLPASHSCGLDPHCCKHGLIITNRLLFHG